MFGRYYKYIKRNKNLLSLRSASVERRANVHWTLCAPQTKILFHNTSPVQNWRVLPKATPWLHCHGLIYAYFSYIHVSFVTMKFPYFTPRYFITVSRTSIGTQKVLSELTQAAHLQPGYALQMRCHNFLTCL